MKAKILALIVVVAMCLCVLASCDKVQGVFDTVKDKVNGIINPGENTEHTHSFVDGKCECGESDPDYVAPHKHNFVDGKCECGESDPNYVPPHTHNFVDGKCECGETDPNYVDPNKPDGTAEKPFALTVPGTLDVDLEAKQYIWYTFTASETKTLGITFSSANAVMGYGLSVDEMFYTPDGATYVEVDLVEGTTYIVNFGTADEAAAEYTVTAEYVEQTVATPESIAGTYYIKAGAIVADVITIVIDANGTITFGDYAYSFVLNDNVSTVTTENGADVSTIIGIIIDANGEVDGFLWNGYEYDLYVPGSEPEEPEEPADPLDTENSELVIGENTITVTADGAAAGAMQYTIVVLKAGTFAVESNDLGAQFLKDNVLQGRGMAYLVAGTYTVSVYAEENFNEGNEYTINLTYTASESEDEPAAPDGSYENPFVAETFPFEGSVSIEAEWGGTIYVDFVAPANGYMTIVANVTNPVDFSINDNYEQTVTYPVIGGQDYTTVIYNGASSEVSFTMSFEEATLTADDYKSMVFNKYVCDATYDWSVYFSKTEAGVYYAQVNYGYEEIEGYTCYYYDYAVEFNADGSISVTLLEVLDLSADYLVNAGAEYVLANEYTLILVPDEWGGYVLEFVTAPIDETELSGAGTSEDPYVITESGKYAFADVNGYPGKLISITAAEAMTLKISANVSELYSKNWIKYAEEGAIYEVALAAGETFTCWVVMESGTADVILTVEFAEAPAGDDDGGEDEVDGTVYLGTDGFGNQTLTVTVSDTTVTFLFSHPMQGESTATFTYLMEDGAMVLYMDGVVVNMAAASITLDANGVPVSAVYNMTNYTLLAEGAEAPETPDNGISLGDNTVYVSDSYNGSTVTFTATESATYVFTSGTNTMVGYDYSSYFTGENFEVVMEAGQTIELVVFTEDWSVGNAIVIIAVKEEAAPCAHNSTSMSETAPSCTAEGLFTVTCDDCGEVVHSEVLAATGHSYTAVVTAPTCTEPGYTTYTCECTDTYIADEVPATGHSYANHVCSVCGGIEEGNFEVTISEALALADGVGVIVSGTVCSIDTAWNENYGNITVTITDADGNKLSLYRLGTNVALGDIITVTGTMASYNGARQTAQGATAEITGHDNSYDYEEMTIAEALAADDGTNVIVTGIVTKIGTAYSEQYGNICVYISDGTNEIYLYRLTGNVAVNDIIIVKGSMATYNGARQVTGGTFTANGTHTHEYDAGVVTAPTCTAAGFTTYTCAGCGATNVADETEKVDHNYVDGACSVCGAAEGAVEYEYVTATMAYTGTTTGNMTGNNDAATVGLDATIFSVVGNKGGTNNNCGLNKNGQIRLYGSSSNGNGSYFTVSVAEGYAIKSIKINFYNTSNCKNCQLSVDGTVLTTTASDSTSQTLESDINASSFKVQNVITGSTTQIYIASIEITYYAV